MPSVLDRSKFADSSLSRIWFMMSNFAYSAFGVQRRDLDERFLKDQRKDILEGECSLIRTALIIG
jgi:hypothetical protein